MQVTATSEAERRYEVVFSRNHRQVYAYFKRRTDLASAKDGTAETFLVAWRKIDEVPDGEAALRWLYGVAHNVLRNQYRAKRRSQRLIGRLSGLSPEHSRSPETVVVRREEDEQVRKALSELRPRDQEILLLALWEELPSDHIAEVLDCTPHAASQRLYRASKQLARQMGAAGHLPDECIVESHRTEEEPA